MEKVVLTVKFEIDAQRIEDTLEGAGIGYWGRFHAVDGAESLCDCKVFDRYAFEDDESMTRDASSYMTQLTREKMLAGIALCAVKYPHHFRDFISGNGDATTGDVIVQCAVFGEVKYG